MNDQKLGTTALTQVGIIVGDIEAKARAWADLLGVPMPEIITTDPIDLAQTEYKGQPTPSQAKLAFFKLGQVDLELIEPIGGPSTWKDQLDHKGESLHHLAFEVNGMQQKISLLEKKGLPLLQKGEYSGGRYAYIDGTDQLGAILELLEND